MSRQRRSRATQSPAGGSRPHTVGVPSAQLGAYTITSGPSALTPSPETDVMVRPGTEPFVAGEDASRGFVARVAPNRPSGDLFAQIGDSGLIRLGGYIEHDYQREWTGERKWRTVNMMLRNPVVAGMVYAVENLIRRVEWRIVPAETPRGEDLAAFVESCRDDMELTWPETIAQFAGYLWYGYALCEILYKRRGGVSDDPTRDSAHADGRVGWRRFSVRAQESIERWEWDEWGRVIAAYQRLPHTGIEVAIPLAKCIHLSTTNRKQNPEGVSLLQAAWDPWFKMTYVQKFEAIGIQRDLAGFPVARIPAAVINGSTPAQQATYAAWKKALAAIQVDEQGNIIIPSDTFEGTTVRQYDFELLKSAGQKQFDTSPVIARYSLQIAQRLMADFLMTANSGTAAGSFAAHTDKTRLFAQAIQSVCDLIAAEFTRQAIQRLALLNGFAREDMPTLVAGNVEGVDLGTLGQFLTALTGAGVPLTDEAQAYLYDAANLPSGELADLRAERKRRAAEMEARMAAAATAPPADPEDVAGAEDAPAAPANVPPGAQPSPGGTKQGA